MLQRLLLALEKIANKSRPKLNPSQKIARIVVLVIGLTLAGLVGFSMFPTETNQGYDPIQPIPFNHKKHASLYKMDCKYCHYSVTKSAHAGVPPLGLCMNCHNVVLANNSPHIKKMRELYAQGKPVEWVRIHELPDHARFNHKRHIAKGVSCERCHGDVKNMERVYQWAPLNMGFCLDCHRGFDTPGNVLSNIKEEDRERNDPSGAVAPYSCVTCHY
jgi:hypothetical protein